MSSFLAVLAVVLISCPTPASALESFQPANYLQDISVDGDIKTVTYLFDSSIPLTNFWLQPSGEKLTYQANEITLFPPKGTTSFTSRTYPLGKEAYDSQVMPVYSAVDVGDIKELAPVSISSRFSVQLRDLTASHMESMVPYTVRYSCGFYAYDASGAYLGVFYGPNETKELYPGDVFDFVARYDDALPSNIKYLLPFVTGVFTPTGSYYDNFDYNGFLIKPWYFRMDVDINMIYEQSQTMQRIEEEIGEIGDKIDDTNDKIDDIITGTPEMKDDADGFEGEIGDTVDDLEDVMKEDDMTKPSIEDMDADIEEYLDPTSQEKISSSVGGVWDFPVANGMLMVVLNLTFASYVLFGKKG